ncbi:IRK-interacting protein [Silene latifolia]|uniref:IRK-interacting protein n=1 Tax=Silene latifolia TaxID=37657 RepID=UPI003D76EDD3
MAPPPSLHPPRSHLFTPIQEGNESEETEAERQRFRESTAAVTLTPASSVTSTDATTSTTHQATPLHEPGKKTRRRESPSESATVSCNNCRPTTRGGEKHSVTVVPVDAARNSHHSLSSTPSPTAGLFKSLISNLSRRSPKPSPSPPPPPPPLPISCAPTDREDQWRAAVAELSHKLVQATRKRDEAIVESSKLKYSMGELEKKLNRLEVYCHTLKSGLEKCHGSNLVHSPPSSTTMMVTNSVNVDKLCDGVVIKSFLVSVSEARSSIRFLSRALTPQLKLMGSKVFDRICTILRSYDIKLTSSYCSNNPRGLQFYLEALLSATFYEDFESVGFSKNSVNRVLNPIDRAELNFGAFKDLKELAWEEVLNKGTKHFSEEFSRFCDRKMSEIVAMLGWSRAWPEQLLQAFFGASKSVWLVHLLANSVHPSLTIFRVEKGARFDPVYMEDMGGDKAKKLIPTVVRIMVAPGFYVYDNVVKCKVVCRYYNSNYSELSSANDM